MWPDDEPGYREWMEWWEALTPEERTHEIALMDQYVADVEREKAADEAFEPEESS